MHATFTEGSQLASIGAQYHTKVLAGALEGKTTREIAAEVGLSWSAIAAFLRSDEAAPQLAEAKRARNEEIGRIGAHTCLDALEVLKTGLASSDEEHRRKCANDILKKWGYPDGAKVEHSGGIAQPAAIDLSQATREQLLILRRGGEIDLGASGDSEDAEG